MSPDILAKEYNLTGEQLEEFTRLVGLLDSNHPSYIQEITKFEADSALRQAISAYSAGSWIIKQSRQADIPTFAADLDAYLRASLR